MSNQISRRHEAAKTKLPLAGSRSTSTPSSSAFEAEERKRLGLDAKRRPVGRGHGQPHGFTKKERAKVTLLIGGLTIAQDFLIEGALKGLGYNVQMLDCPTTAALQTGKEFGNRGQCNPTYFTVGNLVKYLITLRDKHGMTSEEVVKKYVFLTAGACGPCRFGMYVTEYRKALRDAGFDGFRVMLFQQTGGLTQATGDDVRPRDEPDVLLGASSRRIVAATCSTRSATASAPTRSSAGATDRAIEEAKKILYEALETQTNIFVGAVEVQADPRERSKVDTHARRSRRSASSASSGR